MTMLEGDNRPNVYVEGEKTIFRASAAGNCFKNLVAIRMGVEPMEHPPWLLKAFAEGRANEPVILAKLVRDHGWTLEEDAGQGEVELRVGSSIVIRGHVDGVGFHRELGRRVLEAKAFSKTSYAKWQKKGWAAFPYYATQVAIYMEATGLPALMALGLKDENGIVQEVVCETVDEPPVRLPDVKAKLMRAERAARAGELPETCDFDQYPCTTWFLHEDEAETSMAGMDDEFEVNRLCAQWLDGKAMENKGKGMKEDASAALRKWADSHEKVGTKVSTTLYDMTYRVEQVKEGTFTRKAYEKSYPSITAKAKGARKVEDDG